MDLRAVYIFMALCLMSNVGCQRLLQVNVVYRHGDRSPTETFPTDVYQENAWPRGWGQLSNKGQERHLELGKFFRRRYADLIGKFYQPTVISVRSTDVDRTLMSAEANLAGMYPPIANETWTTEVVGWQPLPIHTVPHSMDNLLVRGNNCPRYNAMAEELWTTRPTPEVLVEKTKYARFWRYVKQRAGLPPETGLQDLWFIPDALFIERSNGFPLPAWVTEPVYQHLSDYKDLNFKMMVYNETLARLSGGNLLNQIQSNMRGKLKGEKTKSMYVYSAHDDTVAPLLASMKLFNDKAPPYASAVMLELWESAVEEGSFVRVFYRNDTSINPRPPLHLAVPGCRADCPWKQFLRVTSSSIPKDYDKECRLPREMPVPEKVYDTHRPSSEAVALDSQSFPDEEIPSTQKPAPTGTSVWFVLGCIMLFLSILFVVSFVLFVFFRSFKIEIVINNKDTDREPLLKKDFR